MHDPDEDHDEQPAYDWAAWEENRFSGRSRWWLILMAGTIAAMTLLYFQSGGTMIPWGPPS